MAGAPYSQQRQASRYELAGWLSRMFASIVDSVIFFVAGIAFVLAFRRAGFVVAVVFNIAYLTLLIGSGSGQTVGMRLLQIGIADVDTHQYPIGLARAAVRSVVFLAMSVVPFLALLSVLWPIWDPRNQTLHDKVVRSTATVR
ncbi:MAG: RDD family protein [Acidimicrobiales bacterium]